jgi:ubiquinol-cytochrome c reductase cytochrome b subunit
MTENSEKKIEGFLSSRLGWHKIFQHPIPAHTNNISYTLGGVLLVLGIMLGITGIILQQVYHPHPDIGGAYDSVLEIINISELEFVRSLHYWGAQLMVFVVFLHMIRVFVSDSYKKPREIQWLAGILLLLLLFGFLFSGTILKWDQEAVEALEHQEEVAETLGAVGNVFTSEFAPDVPLLVRLYATHVTLLPAVAIPILTLHLILVRLLGMSVPILKKGKKLILVSTKTVTFSSHVKRMLTYGLIAVMIVILLSVLMPTPLGMRGVEGIEITKPPWYLLWIFPLEDTFGLGSIPIVSVIIVAVLAAVPLLNREIHTNHKKKTLMIIGMFILIGIYLSLTIGGAIAPRAEHL